MWKAIRDVSRDRAVVLTTHSMEEASTLSNKVAILDSKLLTVGSPSDLRSQYGKDVYQIHLVHREGSMASVEQMEEIQRWITARCPGAQSNTVGPILHGQLRLRIALSSRLGEARYSWLRSHYGARAGPASLPELLQTLEMSKTLGVQYYSVNPMTLEDVFLQVVARPGDGSR